jgi:hypothetical protein
MTKNDHEVVVLKFGRDQWREFERLLEAARYAQQQGDTADIAQKVMEEAIRRFL